MKWIAALDLHRWGETRASEAELPAIVRRLVFATAGDVRRIGFRTGESIYLKGLDGVVKAAQATPYVPEGLSVWELSTNKQSASKANGDYKKRVDNPGPVKLSDTTFIFVTPRRWADKDTWAAERSAEGIWKEVRAYDADDLEAWLEQAPGVGAWCARLVGKYSKGVRSLEDFWSEWQSFTRPPLAEDILLSGRDPLAERLKAWLSAPPSPLLVQADTPDEAIAFLGALIASKPSEQRDPILSRALLVENLETWREVAPVTEPLLLVPTFDVTNNAAITAANHYVYLPLTRASPLASNAIVLERPSTESLKKQLIAAGLAEERADRVLQESGKRLAVLRRILAAVPDIAIPAWAQPSEAVVLAPLILMGGWIDANEADRAVAEKITGLPYDKLQVLLTRWANEVDGPIQKIGEQWELVSHEDAWRLLEKYVTPAQLKAFLSACKDILELVDPRFELPAEERFYAGIRGKVHSYSPALRDGLVTALALMGSRGTQAVAYGGSPAQAWVDGFVRRLLEKTEGTKRWVSLHDFLPTLAEAAPDKFLEAVERNLQKQPSPLLELFEEEGDLFGACLHSGLLWALESFAWHPSYLTRITLILGALTCIDPGGRWANRPSASLREIYLPRLPQTTAGLSQQLEALDRLAEREPDAAWTLLSQMLPSYHSTSNHIHRPKWRPWGVDWKTGTTHSEYWKTIEAIVPRLLSLAAQKPERWGSFISAIEPLSPVHRGMILDGLEKLDQSALSPEAIQSIWHAVRHLLHHQNQHASADWHLPEDVLERIEKLYARFTPNVPAHRLAWLFDFHPELPFLKEVDFWKERDELEKERATAASEISKWNTDAILSFAASIKRPDIAGEHLGRLLAEDANLADLLATAFAADDSRLHSFGQGIVSGAFSKRGTVWRDKFLPESLAGGWISVAKALFCLGLPFTKETWSLAESAGNDVSRTYWKEVKPWRLDDPSALPYICDQLLTVQRPNAAFDFAAQYLDSEHRKHLSGKLLIELLMRVAASDPDKGDDKGDRSNLGYYVREAISVLQTLPEITDDEIARVEWTYLPAFRYDEGHSLKLHQRNVSMTLRHLVA